MLILILRPSAGHGKDGRPAGFAHVEFRSLEAAMRALEGHQQAPLEGAGRRLTLDWAHRASVAPRESGTARGPFARESPPSATLFIGNLPFNTSQLVVSAKIKPVQSAKELRLGACPLPLPLSLSPCPHPIPSVRSFPCGR
jgi:RNA recognition motif-containing protein